MDPCAVQGCETERLKARAQLRRAGSLVFSKLIRGTTVMVVLPGEEEAEARKIDRSFWSELRAELLVVIERIDKISPPSN